MAQFTDDLKATGKLEIIVVDKNGNIKDQRLLKNLVVTAGKNYIASRMVGAPAIMSHMGIGSGNTAPAAAQTALTTQIVREAFGAGETPTSTGNVVNFTHKFDTFSGANRTIYEAGIFNAATGGTMLCRTQFPLVTQEPSDTITINWNVTIG